MAGTVDLARLVVQMEAQSEKYLRDLKKQQTATNKWKKKTVASVNSVGKTFRNLAALAGIGLLTKKIIANTAAQQRAVTQLEAGWKSTGGVVGRTVDQMIGHAERLQRQTIFGDEQIIEAQSQLITFTNIVGDQFDLATEASLNLATRMGTDLKSAVIQLGKVLNSPASQLSALARSGIMFNDVQTKMIRDMVKSGDLVGAQTIVLNELEVQFGGSAKAAREDFGGALKGLSNVFGDLFEGNNNNGLKASVVEIESLTTLLQDPKTVEAIGRLTGALISGFSKALGLITDVYGMMQAIGLVSKDDTGPVTLLDKAVAIRKDMAETLAVLNRAMSGGTGSGPDVIDSLREKLRLLNAELKHVEDAMIFAGTQSTPDGKKPVVPVPVIPEVPEVVPKGLTDEQVQTSLDQLVQQLLTEEEATLASYDRRLEIIKEALARQLITEEQALDLRNRSKEEKDAYYLEQEKALADAKREVAESVLDFGIALFKQDSKAARALLAIKKAIAIKEALINLQSAMSNAMKVPWPANIAAIGQVASIGVGILGTLKGIDTSVPSFLGGGYTGDGPRSGGLDGMGGFMAMLHPNETVSDNELGGVTIYQEFDFRGSELSEGRVMTMIGQSNRILEAELRKKMGRGRM